MHRTIRQQAQGAAEASARFYNPAGIAFQKGTQFQVDSLVVGLFRFIPSDTPPGPVVPAKGFPGSVRLKFMPAASMYFTQQVTERTTIGFGVFTPSGGKGRRSVRRTPAECA